MQFGELTEKVMLFLSAEAPLPEISRMQCVCVCWGGVVGGEVVKVIR